eukprot:c24358_g1_i1 orf=347-1795(-)
MMTLLEVIMEITRRVMTWSNIARSVQAFAAYTSLLCFTILLVSKLSSNIDVSWWWIFVPLWIFHGLISRGRFSLPAPSAPHGRNWAPCHAVVAVPLLIAFELLLCTYLDNITEHSKPMVNLKIVFLPLLVFEVTILIDNFRMCRALMPGDEDSMTDEAIWETLPHFWVAVSMVFFIAATLFTLLKLSGDVAALGWWDLFINFVIAECFAFLVCTRWSNPSIHTDRHQAGPNAVTPLTGELVVSASSSTFDLNEAEHMCGLEDIGGHLIKVPVLAFQILLCMKLEGTPSPAKYIPVGVIFIPLFLVQGVAVLFSLLSTVEKFVLVLRANDNSRVGEFFSLVSRAYDCCGFLDHGSRLLGWWSIDESSREEHAPLWHDETSGYNTFYGLPAQIVKKMPRKDLTEEVWRLQAALGEHAERSKIQQEQFNKLQNEKILCRVCFEREIAVVLLPCRHRILCSFCSERCKLCPVCRGSISERMPVYDV